MPSTIAANRLTCPEEAPAAPAEDDAVAAEADREADALLATALVALAEAAEDAEDAGALS